MRSDLANLNTLRAFAVIAVLADHLLMLLITRRIISANSVDAGALGLAGVLAFFVHTSLVLMFSLDRLPEYRRTVVFYIRRIFRIYPLAVLCVALVVTFRIPAAPMTSGFFQPVSTMGIISNVLLIQNLTGVRSVCSPMWSLPFEIQMYMVLPLLNRLASRRRAIVYLAALIAGFGILTLIVQHRTGGPFILVYVPCFLSGVLAYRLRHMRPFLPSAFWPLFVTLWIALQGWGMLHALSLGPTRGPVSGWLATVLLGTGIYCFHDSTNRLWNEAMRIVAKYSFGIYLGHVPVMWLVFYVAQVHGLVVSIFLWLAGTTATAVAAFHLIEEPLINAGKAISTGLQTTARVRPQLAGESPR